MARIYYSPLDDVAAHSAHDPPIFDDASFPIGFFEHLGRNEGSARSSIGDKAFMDAQKGLSRKILSAPEDIEKFIKELALSDPKAVHNDWRNLEYDQTPRFAVSYKQQSKRSHYLQATRSRKSFKRGRCKFSHDQQQILRHFVGLLAKAGIPSFRLWIDQCLSIQDASQHNWINCVLVPYAIWPVVSLDNKVPGEELTKTARISPWVFLEQIAGLWGMGLVATSKNRSSKRIHKISNRILFSYDRRGNTIPCMEPREAMMMVLRNVFHGAICDMKTGWANEKRMLLDVAQANMMYESDDIFLEHDWRSRTEALVPLGKKGMMKKAAVPKGAYLHGSRQLLGQSDECCDFDSRNEEIDLDIDLACDTWRIRTNRGLYILQKQAIDENCLWLLDKYVDGHRKRSQYLSGQSTCNLEVMFQCSNYPGIQNMLRRSENDGDIKMREKPEKSEEGFQSRISSLWSDSVAMFRD